MQTKQRMGPGAGQTKPSPLFGNQIRWARGVLVEAREKRRVGRRGDDRRRPLFGNQIRWSLRVLTERRERNRSR